MQMAKFGAGGRAVSRVGLGGHYRAMEEGAFEERYAYVEREVEHRLPILRRALEGGISLFDTTWRNEVEVLGLTLEQLGARDKVWVNGMVLGAFTGARHAGVTVSAYFNRWLDDRLMAMPGHRFDSFMVNAIEEGFEASECERLIRLLEDRRAAGDISCLGFSTHQPRLARELLDRYPNFEIAMMPYNFRNRALEGAFEGYTGKATLIAMKPLVWAEYGIPFCAVNRLPSFREQLGFEPDSLAAARAMRFILSNKAVDATVCAVNSMAELEVLLQVCDDGLSTADSGLLAQYNEVQTRDSGIPVFLAGLFADNLRLNYFACAHLSKVLGVDMPSIPLNEPDSRDNLMQYARSLRAPLAKLGYTDFPV